MPTIELDERYGEVGAAPVPWEEAEWLLRDAPLSWLSTVRPSSRRVHVTPLVTAWCDGAPHFTTGPAERKARNLAASPMCTLTTGANELHGDADVVVEGEATRLSDRRALDAVRDAFYDKYGAEWDFEVVDGAFSHAGGTAHVFRLEPVVAYAFGKSPYSHTRYRFEQPG